MKSILNQIEFDKKELSTYIILLSAPVLLTLYWYYGNAESFGVYFPRLKSDQYFNFYSYIWQFFSFFILTFMIPAIFIKIYLKRPLTDFGFGLGDINFGLRLVIIVIPLLVVPIIYLASQMPDIRQEYPLSKLLHSHHELVLWYEFTRIFVYYVAWEFFFRGFLLFGLRKQFGSMNAILIQTISSCLIHLGKPEGEILGSIILGIIFGAIAIRTRSFLYVFILHSTIGVLTDIFILFL
jgi:membrane protease YdiL (CAAX protease family)